MIRARVEGVIAAVALAGGCVVTAPYVVQETTVHRELTRTQVSAPPLVPAFAPIALGPAVAFEVGATASAGSHAFPPTAEIGASYGASIGELALTGHVHFGDGPAIAGFHARARRAWDVGPWRLGVQVAAGGERPRIDYTITDVVTTTTFDCDGCAGDRDVDTHTSTGAAWFLAFDGEAGATFEHRAGPGYAGFGAAISAMTFHVPRSEGTETTQWISDGTIIVQGSLPRPLQSLEVLPVPALALSYSLPAGPGSLGVGAWAAPSNGPVPWGATVGWSSQGRAPGAGAETTPP
jgi:hypothetical protein